MRLPDYIIYDRLKEEQEREKDDRPCIYVPQYIPEEPRSESPEEEEDSDRGVTIIQM